TRIMFVRMQAEGDAGPRESDRRRSPGRSSGLTHPTTNIGLLAFLSNGFGRWSGPGDQARPPLQSRLGGGQGTVPARSVSAPETEHLGVCLAFYTGQMIRRLDLRGSTDPSGLLPRARLDVSAALEVVTPICEAVRRGGEAAVREMTARFDGV